MLTGRHGQGHSSVNSTDLTAKLAHLDPCAVFSTLVVRAREVAFDGLR
jgi:hypothetical protein